MRAIVVTKSGRPDGLQLRQVERPAPGEGEVLVRVGASTVTVGDVILRKMHPLLLIPLGLIAGVKRMTTPGIEFAGVVETVGRDTTRFQPGDRVFGTTTGATMGANAEYVCLAEERKAGVMARMPANLTYAEAAALSVGGMTALQLLRKAKIQTGERVLIYGASGSVGTYAVQLARHFGARVTGVCGTRNVELVRTLGAAHVIDYTQADYAAGDQTYDVIFDAVGKSSRSQAKRALKPGGRFISIASPTTETTDDLVFLRELAEAGALSAVIDRRFPLAQTAEAHRYVETGRKRGNVVITPEHDVPP
jgi:NADPH:quinone reductase-like Zn-dependent oxidoreductase